MLCLRHFRRTSQPQSDIMTQPHFTKVQRAIQLFLCAIIWSSSSYLLAQNGVLNLNALENYANQPVPGYITKDNTPADNAITDEGATLGRVLFYDKRLSRTDTISCSSCHQQAHGFSDLPIASTGVNGTTGRHSMRLINSRFAEESRFFWDERAATLEDQSTEPIQDHIEMGFSGTNGDPSFAVLLAKVSAIPEYQTLFTLAFGDASVTENRLQRALAQFVRSIQSFDSKYDTGRLAAGQNNGNFTNFTAAENRGKNLFETPPGRGGAGCVACHQSPEFDIDNNSRNNGVVAGLDGIDDFTNTRSPTLRDLLNPSGQINGPFMHNGAFSTLTQVVQHYNAIPAVVPNLDRRLQNRGTPQNLGLNATEVADIVAFLGTLSGNDVYTNEKWSDPFDATGKLQLITEQNQAPVLQPVANQMVVAGSSLVVQLAASDPDLPAQTLTYSLAAGAPSGMNVAPLSGLLSYTPDANSTGSVQVTVNVEDDGTPPLSASQPVSITVATMPVLTGIQFDPATGMLMLDWQTTPTVAYRLDWCDSLTTPNWQPVGTLQAGATSLSLGHQPGLNVTCGFYRAVLMP